MAVIGGSQAALAHHGNYRYGTPPFNPNYPSGGSVIIDNGNIRIDTPNYNTYPTPYQNPNFINGCQVVDDTDDYFALMKIDRRNRGRIVDIQKRLGYGECIIVRVDRYGDDTYLAVDSQRIRWATRNEISHYNRGYRY